jgi:lipopolysaccharide biosynthesis regulator YciM
MGNYKKAISLWSDIAQRYPGHLIAYYCCAITYKKLGDASNYKKYLNICYNLIQESKDDLAISQYNSFKDKLTELNSLITTKTPLVKIERNLKTGMPNRASSTI